MSPSPQTLFISVFCEALLYGAYTVLTGGTLYLLIRKPRRKRMERTNLVMIALTVLMYVLSTVHIALLIRVDFGVLFDDQATDGASRGTTSNENADPRVLTLAVMEVANYLIGDGIVCWRTWILWDRNYRVLVFPVTCIVGLFGSGIGMVVAMARSPPGSTQYSNDTVLWSGVVSGLACLNTVYSICMMYWRLRMSTRCSKVVRVVGVAQTYHSLAFLFIESGAVYLLAIVILLVLFLAGSTGVYVIGDMLTPLAGIYPTVIIVMVNLKMTLHNDVMTRMSETTTSQADAFRRKGGGGVVVESHVLQDRPGGTFTWRIKNDTEEDTYATESSSTANGIEPIQISVDTETTWIDYRRRDLGNDAAA